MKLTEKAAAEVKRVMSLQELNLEDSYLRVTVAGGGCSGVSYGMSFDDNKGVNPLQDIFITQDGLKIVVERRFEGALSDTTIDYLESETKSGFTFQNATAAPAGGGCCGGGGCSR